VMMEHFAFWRIAQQLTAPVNRRYLIEETEPRNSR
jgi:hypothetical protein